MGKSSTRKRTSYDHPTVGDFTSEKQKGCEGKKTYVSQRIADREVEVQIEITGNPEFRSYKCSFCKRWHITKSQKLG